MIFNLLLFLTLALYAGVSHAEGGCPPGQYPIGGQGAMACAPIPQENSQQKPQPSGKWIKTWGAIAMGSIDSIANYGVTTGKLSKSDAEDDALTRCASHGEKNCRVGLTYRNQCAVIVEPQVDGKPMSGGTVRFIGRDTTASASNDALELCRKDNKTIVNAECTIVYKACSEPIFQSF
ncbi:DUF4189 domain-containing protein [Xanthomonas campestris pv. paulliniae]|uniref:DUF4189 domain-containing protein n=1 Tax=Xanthomonas euvesicatoria TaxID=456327 RepID=UPI001C436C81|nr:DUF4189 domain-containing protein [Xanthomonas euvesicatoria]MBV6846597.1 DUF4189 domain-containing protein [Xanthomonas campestris pv. paulliniae]